MSFVLIISIIFIIIIIAVIIIIIILLMPSLCSSVEWLEASFCIAGPGLDDSRRENFDLIIYFSSLGLSLSLLLLLIIIIITILI